MNTTAPKVLLVEDNPGDVGLIVEAIDRLRKGIQLEVAANAEHALKLLGLDESRSQSVHPDMIFLDFNLPGMKGLEMLETVRGEPRFAKTEIKILTSSTSPDDVRRAQELGADDYLVKPFTFKALVDLLKHATSRWEPMPRNLN